ncbi:lectin family glycoprotein receptor [Schizosaccharomyces japonicus yFS275]|uniref:Lectin family glycoprotein receptor n=1 Tax=Schizosaccharomyces japonicus (strain yFS275 / FY16936) TaxID=402676 RepID=B6K1B4_SCHJY|nr:lectin family glycoprotein receptor [Schizosaccharomyces japonicus yFS275]EEB07735.1 lectin family glycoprotein receptor [Schizosaccharomyces japonicus yFS275]
MHFCSSIFAILTGIASLGTGYAALNPDQLNFERSDKQLPHEWTISEGAEVVDTSIALTQVSGRSYRTGGLWTSSTNSFKSWDLSAEMIFPIVESSESSAGMWYTRNKGVSGPIVGSQDGWDGLLITYTVDSSGKVTVRGHLNDGSLQLSLYTDPDMQAFAKCVIDKPVSASPSALYDAHLHYEHNVLKLDVNGQQCFEAPGIALPTDFWFGLTSASASQNDVVKIDSLHLSDAYAVKLPQSAVEQPQAVAPSGGAVMSSQLNKELNMHYEFLKGELSRLESRMDNVMSRLNELSVRLKSVYEFASRLDESTLTKSSKGYDALYDTLVQNQQHIRLLEEYLQNAVNKYENSQSSLNTLTKAETQHLKELAMKSHSSSRFTNFLLFLMGVTGGIIALYLIRKDRRGEKYL